MAVDYDLVVIGSSRAGIDAAKSAAVLQARVALVTQCDELFLPNDTLFNCSISEVGQFNDRLATNPFAVTSDTETLSLTQAIDWARGIDSTMQKGDNSLANLAALGVDVIAGKGEFYRLPHLGFAVANRQLRSRNYLLATGVNYVPRFLGADSTDNYLTLRELSDRNLPTLGSNLIVVGSNPMALELAQTLARFEKEVTLIVEQSRILPHEDLDLALLIQAQLETEGVKIYSNSKVSQIATLDGQKWLQAGDRAFNADTIIIADYRQPNITGLNLAGVNVKYDLQRVWVNRKLQTTNPHIYACGDLIGGYSLPDLARQEVKIILKNTLFFPWYRINYYALPWAVLTKPNLARVGLTERQARERYGEDVYAIAQNIRDTARGQVEDRTTGMCKLLVRSDGEIIGCSLVGDRAGELITVIALMMQHNLRLDPNPMRGITSVSVPTVYPSMAEILDACSQSFYQQKLQGDRGLLNRLRSWFSLCKNWHR